MQRKIKLKLPPSCTSDATCDSSSSSHLHCDRLILLSCGMDMRWLEIETTRLSFSFIFSHHRTMTQPLVDGRLSATCAVAAVSGLIAHRAFFIHGFWHVAATSILEGHFFSCLLLFATILSFSKPLNVSAAALQTLLASTSYVVALFASIVTYRCLFHPLRKVPGPLLGKISKLYHAYNCRSLENYLFLDSLRMKYGNVVRSGK